MNYLGIDLGTTNSVAVVFKNDNLEVIKIDFSDEILPSVVCFNNDEVIVGNEAKSGAIIFPDNTILGIKRYIGSDKVFDINGVQKSQEEISSEILKKLKLSAQEQTGQIYDEVVITHPAYFNDRQIYLTKQAGILAGFKNIFLLSEPLAAAIEYGFKQSYAQTLLVYDLGGGTFDVCILEVSLNKQGEQIYKELSAVGDMNLGGDDFDAQIIKWMKSEFKKINNISLDDICEEERKRVMQKLKHEAEQIKKRLSGTNKTSIRINPLLIKDGIPINLCLDLTKEEFEAMIRPYIDKSREIMMEALSRANKSPDEISKVILVGGSTLIPMVKRMVAGFIKEPYRATDPAKSVAMGAAIYNYLVHLPNSNVKVSQITRQLFGTEAVTNLTTMKKELIPIIPMGIQIPVKVSDSNFASMSGSTSVLVDVYQWEKGFEENKKFIGSVVLDGLSGTTQIEITYAIDENNLFEVYVKDILNGKLKKAEFDRTKFLPTPEHIKFSNNVNIIFLIDTTGSMDTYINGVKDRAIEFSNILNSKGAKFELGLVGFGDLNEGENPSVYSLTNDVFKFQKQVKNIPRTHGGDIPESSLDAIETAINLLKDTKIDELDKNIFILITDAPPHKKTISGKTAEDISFELKEKNITTYVVARKDRESIESYDILTKPNGKYYDLNDRFFDILDNIAVSITELIRL